MRLVYILLLCVGFVVSAIAQPTKSELAQAKKRFDEAEVAYRLQDYQKALDGFRDAYKLSNRAGLLFNIAQCYRELNQLEESIKSYEAFIFDEPNSPYKAEAEKNIAEIKAILAEQRAKEEAAAQNTKAKPSKKPYKALYITSAASGGLGVASGVVFFVSFQNFKELDNNVTDANVLAADALKLKVTSVVADSLIALSIASAGAAFFLQKRSQKKVSPSAMLLPSSEGLWVGATLQF
jgi:tetratricopeptide (TPR) repeat protein